MTETPLVTIVITTKDRHEDLAKTLGDLKQQSYPNLEMLVIDDASKRPIEPVVRAIWPEARVIRHEQNRGINVRRNEGYRLASGEFIASIDDDLSPAEANAISLSVAHMQAMPCCAVIAYYLWNGTAAPENLGNDKIAPGNCLTFPGGACFLRKSAFDETAGFREIYVTRGEETELSLQLLKKGWNVSFRPEILTLHRCSAPKSNRPGAWKLTVRNSIWTSLIHYPVSRLVVDLAWRIVSGAWDAFRMMRYRLFFEAIWEAASGAGKVLRLREPMKEIDLRRYDALRAYDVLPYEMFEDPPKERWSIFWKIVDRWRNRIRDGSFYTKGEKLGRGQYPTHEHELQR